jgi:hypothetical protein
VPSFVAPLDPRGLGTPCADPQDPWFQAPGDYRLLPDSPGVDAALLDLAPEVDLDGNRRPCGGAPDMGAFEAARCDLTPPARFRRGDANADAAWDIADAVFVLRYLFQAGPAPTCLDSADIDDGGRLDISDAVALLRYLFSGGWPPSAPFLDGCGACGFDPSVDALDCASYAPCT